MYSSILELVTHLSANSAQCQWYFTSQIYFKLTQKNFDFFQFQKYAHLRRTLWTVAMCNFLAQATIALHSSRRQAAYTCVFLSPSSIIRHATRHTNPFPISVADSQPFRSRANSLPGANRPIGPWPIHSLELSFLGPFAPWPSRSLELSLPGAKWPGNFRSRELSHSGVFAPRNIRSLELSFPISLWHYLWHWIYSDDIDVFVIHVGLQKYCDNDSS